MPASTYQQLLAETVPEVIVNEEQYQEIGSRLGGLVGKGRARSSDETKHMRLLAKPPKREPITSYCSSFTIISGTVSARSCWYVAAGIRSPP